MIALSQISISSPELLHLTDRQTTYYGANQLWYATEWQRRAGCGPTAASHLLWYLSQSGSGCGPLCTYDCSGRGGFLCLMETVWQYVTPTKMGVNSTDIFTEGALRYARDRGVTLDARVLEISSVPFLRPKPGELSAFLTAAMSDNLPVAFLNLSNGSLRNLDNWHWVTLVSIDPGALTAQMYDQGARQTIDLGRWLKTTTLGGGFVVLDPEPAAQ